MPTNRACVDDFDVIYPVYYVDESQKPRRPQNTLSPAPTSSAILEQAASRSRVVAHGTSRMDPVKRRVEYVSSPASLSMSRACDLANLVWGLKHRLIRCSDHYGRSQLRFLQPHFQ
jgi:hypothetical protein